MCVRACVVHVYVYVNGHVYGVVGVCLCARASVYMNVCMHACLYTRTDVWLVSWMDGWMDGRTDGGMDGWTEAGRDGWGCFACTHVSEERTGKLNACQCVLACANPG